MTVENQNRTKIKRKMKNENWIDINDGKISGFEFFQLVLAEFPQLECEMNEWKQTYIHMKMEISRSKRISVRILARIY